MSLPPQATTRARKCSEDAELSAVAVVINRSPSVAGSTTPLQSAAQMIKSLSALAIFALLGASVVALPAWAPQAKAGETVAMAKADRLPVHVIARKCSSQVWPNFDGSCLRDGGSGDLVQQARLVTVR
jgi:hypothetical protein